MSREGPKGEARPAPKGGKATGRFSSLFTEGRGDFLRPGPNAATQTVLRRRADGIGCRHRIFGERKQKK